MDAERFRELRRVFESALETIPDEREGHVLRETGGDRDLAGQVFDLLRETADATPVREALLDAGPGAALAVADLLGQRVGRFAILRRLGAGGMGTVYEARQDRPQRLVALKTLSVALRSERARRRFEDEAEILARLAHPGIAQVLEVGTLGSGDGQVPWFAMELVEDPLPIDAFVRQRGLGPREVAALFAEVCDAVHHAHQRGVLHRDLKPQNVLVDVHGRPKVIDFGIARLGDGDRLGLTRTGELLGTLTYMSPERLEHGAAADDTAGDVWALGVVLHELLAGAPPFAVDGLPPARAVDVLRTHEPAPPSRTRPEVARELDWIVRRAMARSPQARCASAAELGADLRRFLAGEPVQAGPQSATYWLTAFARRHRGAVAAAVTVVLALAVGLAVALAGWRSASEAERRATSGQRRAEDVERVARREAATLAEVGAFQQRILRGAFGHQSGRDVRLADVVDAAAADLERRPFADPHVELGVRNAVGTSYLGLGLLGEAERQFERAREVAAAAGIDADDAAVIALGNNLGVLRKDQGRLPEAEAELLRSLGARVQRYGEDDEETAVARLNLAIVQLDLGRAAAALENAAGALATFARVHGESSEQAIRARARVAAALAALGRVDEADATFEAAFAAAQQHLGEDHPGALDVANSRATHLRARGRSEEYVVAVGRIADVYERLFGPAHPRTLKQRNNVAVGQLDRGDLAGAEATLRAIQDARAAAGLDAGFDYVATGQNLVATIRRQGRAADAEIAARENRELAQRTLPAGNWLTFVTTKEHGACLRELGRFADAEPLLLEAARGLEAAVGAADARTQKVVQELVQLYAAMQRDDDAALWRQRLAPAEARGAR